MVGVSADLVEVVGYFYTSIIRVTCFTGLTPIGTQPSDIYFLR